MFKTDLDLLFKYVFVLCTIAYYSMAENFSLAADALYLQRIWIYYVDMCMLYVLWHTCHCRNILNSS